MERVLIISDVHLRINRVNKIIDYEKPDKVVFLGDFFDQFDDSIEETQEVARWLSVNLHNPKYIFCWGNHDVSYAFYNRAARCSGYTQAKDMAINDIMRPKDWDKFVWFYWITDNILVSHAGLTKGLAAQEIGSNIVTVEQVKKLLAVNNSKASICLRSQKSHWFYKAGRSRGGTEYFGGLNWCDVREFVPIDGIMQIFGHTPCRSPIYKYEAETGTGFLCLDTHNNHYAIYTDTIQILNYSDIPNYK